MADDALRELLTSPLAREEPDRERKPRPARWLSPWFVAALLAGGLAVLGGYSLAGPTTATEQATATTAAPTDLAPAPLPPGFGPLHEYVGGRVERVLVGRESTWVTIATAVPAGIDGGGSAGFPGGRWELVLADGRRVPSVSEVSHYTMPGYVTVRFDAGDVGAPVRVDLVAVAHRAQQPVEGVTADGLVLVDDNAEITMPLGRDEYALGPETMLHVSELTLRPTGATVEWNLAGGPSDAAIMTFSGSIITEERSFGLGHGSWLFAETDTTAQVGGIVELELDRWFSAPSTIPTGVDFSVHVEGWVTLVQYSPADGSLPIDRTVVVIAG